MILAAGDVRVGAGGEDLLVRRGHHLAQPVSARVQRDGALRRRWHHRVHARVSNQHLLLPVLRGKNISASVRRWACNANIAFCSFMRSSESPARRACPRSRAQRSTARRRSMSSVVVQASAGSPRRLHRRELTARWRRPRTLRSWRRTFGPRRRDPCRTRRTLAVSCEASIRSSREHGGEMHAVPRRPVRGRAMNERRYLTFFEGTEAIGREGRQAEAAEGDGARVLSGSSSRGDLSSPPSGMAARRRRHRRHPARRRSRRWQGARSRQLRVPAALFGALWAATSAASGPRPRRSVDCASRTGSALARRQTTIAQVDARRRSRLGWRGHVVLAAGVRALAAAQRRQLYARSTPVARGRSSSRRRTPILGGERAEATIETARIAT